MTATTPVPMKNGKLSSTLWPAIWNIVQDLGLKAGDQLPSIRELADRLDVKQTAVRDALLKAETTGLVKVQPRAGAFLRASVASQQEMAPSAEFPLEEIFRKNLAQNDCNLFHLLDARRLIEIEMAGRAAERRRLEDLLPVRKVLEGMLQLPSDAARPEYVDYDVRFHVEVARLSGNLALFAVQRTLMGLLRPHLNEVPMEAERRSITDRSHIAIYEALLAGDAEKARTEMRTHLSLAYDCLLHDMQKLPVNTPDC